MRAMTYTKTAGEGRVFAKAVKGRLLYAHKVSSNTQEGLDTWIEYPTIEEAAKILGTPVPEQRGVIILDKKHKPIDWSKFKGGYYIPFSTIEGEV